jgi:hypothetical protein
MIGTSWHASGRHLKRTWSLASICLLLFTLDSAALPGTRQPSGPVLREGFICRGCGCKGGPGWRTRPDSPYGKGYCVSRKGLKHECGDPPSNRCVFEGATQVCPSERGCGREGGPGWRELATGYCVAREDLTQKCGDPPSSEFCEFEGYPQVRPSQRGCGSRGGSGWRDKSSGRCVPRKRLKQTCGDPPSAPLCTFELPTPPESGT